MSAFPSYTSDELRELQRNDPNISRFNALYTSHATLSHSQRKLESNAVKVLLRQAKHLFLRDGILFRSVSDPKLGWFTPICVAILFEVYSPG